MGKRAKKGHRKEMRALVDNADGGVALAVIRSLGRRGIDITAASGIPSALSFRSKYCKRKVLYTSPEKDENKFLHEMLEIVKRGNYDVLFTMGGYEMELISRHREKFVPYVKIPLAAHETLEKAVDKYQTFKTAIENNIPCPQTYLMADDLTKLVNRFEFPAVIKPRKGEGAKGLAIINSKDELKNIKYNKHQGYIVQEYIPYEEKYAVACIFNHDSKPRRACVLKYIREHPITGGVSTFAESVERADVLKYALKLLKVLNYYGVAEVEFVVDSRDKKPKLMEINPRFWGSLSAAISAGVDFPYLLYRMAIDGDIKPSLNYKVGVKCRNLLFGDIRYLVDMMKGTWPKHVKLQTLVNFLKFHEDRAYYILSLDDPMPAIFKVIRSISHMIKSKDQA